MKKEDIIKMYKEKRYRMNSFERLALDSLEDYTIPELQRQYNEKGTRYMAKHWGYCTTTIRNSLKRMGVKLFPGGWHRRRMNLQKKIEKLGGMNSLLKKHKGSAREISKELDISNSKMCSLLHEAGFVYEGRKRGWRKKIKN